MATMRSVGVRLRMFVDQYKRDAAEAKKATEGVGASGKKAKVDLDQLAGTLTVVGGLMTAAAAATVIASARFDKEMSAVAAATGAAGDELADLREAALEAGAATSFSATEAADAIEQLAKAGVSAADVLGGALTGALSLAAAGEIEVGVAAETAASAMTQFKLEGSDVGHIADLLAAGAGKAQGGVLDMGEALKQAGLVASQTGLSIEETTGTLAAFASAGLLGSDAGTSFRTMLLRLAAPTGESAQLMEDLGIEAFDAGGNFVGMAKLAGSLETALSGLTQEQRQAAFATIFGQDAIRAASIAYALGEDGIQEWIAAVNDQGFATRQAEALTDNLVGDIERLTGSLETLFIEAGSGANGGLRFLAQTGEQLANTFGGMPATMQTTGVVLAAGTGIAALAAAAYLKLKSSVADAAENLAKAGPAGARAGRALTAVVSAGSKAVGVLGALAVASAAVDAATEDLNPQLDALAAGLDRWADGAGASGEIARLFGEDLEGLGDSLATAASSGAEFADEIKGATFGLVQFTGEADIEKIKALDSALASMVQGGNLREAAKAFDELTEVAAANGVTVEQLRELLPEYAGALEVSEKETDDLADTTHQLELAQLAAVDSGEALIDVWLALHGAAKTADEEMLEAVQSINAVTEAFEENGGALQGNSEAALENRLALAEAAQQAIEAADAFIANGGSAEDAAAMLEDFERRAADAAIAAGGNADEVHRLADELFQLPASKYVAVNVQLNVASNTGFGLAAFSQLRHGGITMGGVPVQHAATGLLRDATIATKPMVSWAEPETEREAFVPKRGNYSRSMGILSEAAGWYNADVVPRGTWAGGGASAVDVRVSLAPGADTPLMRAIEDRLRVEVVQAGGGSVQGRYGQRGRQV